jgi:HD-GYP domain-containing protein (c-di-GMP phosphodiesterase class II)
LDDHWGSKPDEDAGILAMRNIIWTASKLGQASALMRIALILASLALYHADFKIVGLAVLLGYAGATAVIGWNWCRTSAALSKNSRKILVTRIADCLVWPAVGLMIPGHSSQLWLVCVPLLLAQSLSNESQFEVWLCTGLAVLSQAGSTIYLHTPVQDIIRDVLLLVVTPVIGMILGRYQQADSRLSASDRRMSSLISVAGAVSSSTSLNALILAGIQAVVKDLNATGGYVMLVDEEGKRLRSEAAYGADGSFEVPESLDLGSGISGYVAKIGQPIEVHNDGDDRLDCDGLSLNVKSATSVPLISRTFGSASQAARQEVLGAMTILRCDQGGQIQGADMDMVMSVNALLSSAIANTRMQERQRSIFLLTLECLATALEARDEYTKGHSQRVCDVSMLIGQKLGFTPEALEELRVGTTLHDIGKIGVPDSILNKPDRLTDEEFALMKSHPVIGYEICKPLMLSEGVLMLIRNHHEKLDGRGYPDGLRGGELPLSLRVVCVADAFDAMSSRRPYRQVMDMSRVIAELAQGAGSQFDPVVVESLRDLLSSGSLDEIYASQWHPVEERRAA